ncbi:MAG TPA: alanine--tRNA ligase [Thermoanaerobaculia bacterium]|nr:alanine--tRNA ligase [Thermoanaerobaculia bacterium]
MKSSDVRQQFFRFYQERSHAFVPSSPVVPLDDPTLLFTNAGMNQFKDVFLGRESITTPRAVNAQKCIRAGGKHNDLDDVGRDTYHQTFFEMLGTWSFGDYFKRDSIAWAWELLTEVWGIEPARLHASYFAGDEADGLGPDLESRDLWLEVTGIDPSHVHPFGRKDNFWEMADVGPCGPSSEIHVDLTPDRSGAALVNADDPRVFEIWNHVFIQFNRDAEGRLAPLAAQHVDTGMGFERLLAVLQGKRSNYDTDLFAPILEAIREHTGAPAYSGTLPAERPGHDELRDVAYRCVADHLRCLAFAITDGALPDNEGRGYVLRRVLRRAYRYGRQYLGVRRPFLHELVPAVVAVMGDAYPELAAAEQRVRAVVREEEESFARTLDHGIKLFDQAAERAAASDDRRIPGEVAFKLHDTYGFPVDLTRIIAEERGLAVDVGGYERHMEEARERARQAGRGGERDAARELLAAAANHDEAFFARIATDDAPKWRTTELSARLTGWLDADGELREEPLEAGGGIAALLLDATCFYAEQGGQVGDRGTIEGPEGTFEVLDTQRVRDTVLHLGRVARGRLAPGSTVAARVDDGRRERIMANHTATHLLNLALRDVLGEHVQQKGSLVDEDRTRFDFAHGAALTDDEIGRIEALVEEQIGADCRVYDREMPLAEAMAIRGLRAVFGEKYPERVRVVSVGVPVETLAAQAGDDRARVSIELCGGTHVDATSRLDRFAVVAEESVAQGVRRVVGMTGEAAHETLESGRRLRERAAALAAGADALPGDELAAGIAELQEALAGAQLALRDRRQLHVTLGELQMALKRRQEAQGREKAQTAVERARELLDGAERIDGTAVVIGEIAGVGPQQLREAMDLLRQRERSAAVLLLAPSQDDEGKVALLAGFTGDLVQRGAHAGKLIREVAPLVGGSGGGKPDLAQGGGRDAAGIPQAMERAAAWMREVLSAA